jgi:alpha-L-arabinofuranosidase
VAKAMLQVDPNLVLVASGDLGTMSGGGGGGGGRRGGGRQRSWSQGMLEDSGDNMDLISEHFYSRQMLDDIPAHVAQIVDSIRSKAEGHRRLQNVVPPAGKATIGNESTEGPRRIIPIAMDEWNYWFQPYEYGELGCIYELRDALGIAAGLHEYFRNSDIIHMAEYAQTVNVIGCIKTTKTDAFFDTTALPLLLYRREFGTRPLAVTGNHDVLALDVAAARTEDGREVTIGVVNPNDKPQKLKLKLNGLALADKAKVWRIAGDNPTATNSAENERVKISDEQTIAFDNELEVPGYSINVCRVAVE